MEYLKPCPFCGCKWKKVGITRISFLLYHDPNCFFWCIGYPVMEHSAGDGNMPKRIIKWNQRAELTCDGCRHDVYPEKDICLMCVRGTFDRYEAKEEE